MGSTWSHLWPVYTLASSLPSSPSSTPIDMLCTVRIIWWRWFFAHPKSKMRPFQSPICIDMKDPKQGQPVGLIMSMLVRSYENIPPTHARTHTLDNIIWLSNTWSRDSALNWNDVHSMIKCKIAIWWRWLQFNNDHHCDIGFNQTDCLCQKWVMVYHYLSLYPVTSHTINKIGSCGSNNNTND